MRVQLKDGVSHVDAEVQGLSSKLAKSKASLPFSKEAFDIWVGPHVEDDWMERITPENIIEVVKVWDMACDDSHCLQVSTVKVRCLHLDGSACARNSSNRNARLFRLLRLTVA